MLTIGLVGHGRWGKVHASTLIELKSIHVFSRLVVCDIDVNQHTQNMHIDAYYSSIHEMLANEACDGIVIVTPPDTHIELATICSHQSVPFFIEKPTAMDAQESFNFLSNLTPSTVFNIGYLLQYHPLLPRVRHHFADWKGMLKIQYVRHTKRVNTHGFDALDTFMLHGLNFVQECLGIELEHASTTILSNEPNHCEVEVNVGQVHIVLSAGWNFQHEEKWCSFESPNASLVIQFDEYSMYSMNGIIINNKNQEHHSPLRKQWNFWINQIKNNEPLSSETKQHYLDIEQWRVLVKALLN